MAPFTVFAVILDSSIRIGALLRTWKSGCAVIAFKGHWPTKLFLLLTIPTMIGTVLCPQIPLMKGAKPLIILSLVGVLATKSVYLTERGHTATDKERLVRLDKEATLNFLWSPLLTWIAYMSVLWLRL